jgi:hypothetical protein
MLPPWVEPGDGPPHHNLSRIGYGLSKDRVEAVRPPLWRPSPEHNGPAPAPCPRGKSGDGTPTPPRSYMIGPDLMPFFRRIPFLSSRGDPGGSPPVMGPVAKNFKKISTRGISWRGQAHIIPLKKRDTLSTA